MKKTGQKREALRLLHAHAPLRINDIGGWTDTWFAKEGNVLNLAVSPSVEVQVKVFANKKSKSKRVLVQADNYGESFRVDPEAPSAARHPLLQFALSSLPIPKNLELEVNIHSPVPAGISAGTSASVCVALLGAIDLLTEQGHTPGEIASIAHRVETEKLKQQSGIQDQVCAAYGGACYIHMHNYPDYEVEKLKLSESVRQELDRRICLIYLGKPHRSSSIHEQVIAHLEAGGARFEQIRKMRDLAIKAKSFLLQGRLADYGDAMAQNNECQRELCPGLISKEADAVIAIARKLNALGWKVNGAGGQGGSMTVFANADDDLRRRMLRDIDSLGKGIKPLPISLSSEGLTAWAV